MTSAYQEWLRSPRQATPMCKCGHEWIRHAGLRRQCEHCDSWYRTKPEIAAECIDCRKETWRHPFTAALQEGEGE